MATPLVRDYAGSTVLVAGGTSGVGLASAVGFVRAGVHRVALLGRDPERGAAAAAVVSAAAPDVDVVFLGTDATDVQQVDAAVQQVQERFGSLDVLVSSVTGGYRPELLHRTPATDIEAILVGQAIPPMLLTRAALPVMAEQGGGSIVCVASDAAKVPTPGETVLGAAMAAIVLFCRTTAMEAKRNGIRVNAVTPSLIAGTRTAENVLSDGFSKSLFEKATALAHLGVAEAEDLAALIVFLGGPAAARLTGQAISVNGGISAG